MINGEVIVDNFAGRAVELPNCRADRLGEDAGGQLRFA
nr:MAG TPA: hypothetical protein [Caudoviricetes sp.]